MGPKTEEALCRFCRARGLEPQLEEPSLWRALGLRFEVVHPVPLVPQRHEMECWAAAAAMLIGHRPHLKRTRLGPEGGLLLGPENVATFAEEIGFEMHPPRLWRWEELLELLKRSPLLVVAGCGGRGRWTSWFHTVVLSGALSDSTPHATLIRVHDPWPPGQGRIEGRFLEGTTLEGFRFISLYTLIPRRFPLGAQASDEGQGQLAIF